VNIFKALSNLIEGLSQSPSVFGLAISDNEITAKYKFYTLLVILFTKSLQFLYLSGNNLRGSMPLLAPALNHSNLIALRLSHCCLDDNDIICLGKALKRNFTLFILDVTGNCISQYAFSELLLAIQYSVVSIL